MYTLNLTITEKELHPDYAHVHHADVIRLLEYARTSWMASIGFPMERLLVEQFFPVITNIQVSYKREVLLGPITITCDSPRMQGIALLVDQQIINAKGKVAVAATVESKFMNGVTKRADAPPTSFLEKFINS